MVAPARVDTGQPHPAHYPGVSHYQRVARPDLAYYQPRQRGPVPHAVRRVWRVVLGAYGDVISVGVHREHIAAYRPGPGWGILSPSAPGAPRERGSRLVR